MAKLYWRIKRDGKWTWVPATTDNSRVTAPDTDKLGFLPIAILERLLYQEAEK